MLLGIDLSLVLLGLEVTKPNGERAFENTSRPFTNNEVVLGYPFLTHGHNLSCNDMISTPFDLPTVVV